MARVYITTSEKRNARLAAWVYGEMKVKRITQEDIASKRGVSRQAIGKKLKNQSFDFEDLAVFVEIFEPSERELMRLVRGTE